MVLLDEVEEANRGQRRNPLAAERTMSERR
jgi:hypothetical protein